MTRYGLDPDDPRTGQLDSLYHERFGDPERLEAERGNPSLHACPGGCGRRIARHLFACRRCWWRLPADLRRPISDTYRRDNRAHAQAMADARRWYTDHAASTTGGGTC